MLTPANIVIACVPILVLLLDQFECRFGTARAGWMAGLPVVAGPALLMFTLDHGIPFAQEAALNLLFGLVGWVGFVLSYLFLPAGRHPIYVVLSSMGAWAAIVTLMSFVGRTDIYIGGALAIIVGAALVFGRIVLRAKSDLKRSSLVRMGLATALVVVVSTLGHRFGPKIAGLITTFPIVASSMLVPIWLRGELERSRALASGMLISGPSLAIFAFSIWLMYVEGLTPLVAFPVATIVTAAGHFLLWRFAQASSTIKPGADMKR